MIKLIVGAKGSGKTKEIINQANEKIKQTNGDVLFITDIAHYPSIYINPRIRLINTVSNGMVGEKIFEGALMGMYSCNYDITDIFIDGLQRITCLKIDEMKAFYDFLEDFSEKTGIDFTITVSSDTIPDFMNRFSVLRLNRE